MIRSGRQLEFNYSPVRVAPDRRLMSEIEDIKEAGVSSSQKVGYTLLNRSRLGEASPIVAPGGFMSDLTTSARGYEGLCLAGLDRPVMMVDMLGHGRSSPHSPGQTLDLCFNRSANWSAAPLMEAVLSVLPSDDAIDYFGISYGGLLALEMTRSDPGDRVGSVFGLEIPAVKRHWSLGLQLGYLLLDGRIGRHQYLRQLKSGPLADNFDDFLGEFDGLGIDPADKFFKNNPGLAGLNLFMSVAARPAALEAWAEVMDRKSARVDVVTAELSSVSDHKAIDLFISSMQVEHQRRSQQTVVYGEDHNMGQPQLMPRTVSWADRAYGGAS